MTDTYLMVVLRICAIFGFAAQASLAFYTSCRPLQYQHGIQCFDNYETEFNCTEVLPIGTRVKCKEFYQSLTTDETSCRPEGWSVPEFKCQIMCGMSKEMNGQDRPFGATIYQVIKKDMNSKICAGTLIGDGFVITIAHCMLDHMDKQLSNAILLVGLGPVANETIYQVKDVVFTTKFNETSIVDPNDLAILTLEDFQLSRDILPACLPSCGQMDAFALRDGSTGEIFPRGRGKPEKLKVKVTANCTHFNDFCAGSTFGDARSKKCPEEIGTGITVSIGEEAHFIYGVLSSTPQPTCKNSRTFKRIFPFISWITTVAMIGTPSSEPLDQPISTTPSSTESHPTSTERYQTSTENYLKGTESHLTTAESRWTHLSAGIAFLIEAPQTSTVPESILSTTSTKALHEPVIYDSPAEATFLEIPKEEQMGLVNLTIREKTIKNRVLTNSLKFAKSLVRLDIHNCTLDSGFNSVEDLPLITQYILTEAYFQERPQTFQEYFPFFKARTLDLSDFPTFFEEVNIDDSFRRFLLKPSHGLLLISNFQNLNVDKILTGLFPRNKPPNFEWKRIVLENVDFHYDAIPPSVLSLRLSSVNLTGKELSKLLSKLEDLESLGIHDLEDRELKLEDLPTKSLQRLRLDRVNLTSTPEPASYLSSFFSSRKELPEFNALVQFYWGLEVVLDEGILTNLATIFPNLKQAAYFGRNNLGIVETLLGLPQLELLYIRIHEVRSGETLKILEAIHFDLANSTVGPNLDIIHVCVERKSGEKELTSRYLGSRKELFEVDEKFDDGVDILQCMDG